MQHVTSALYLQCDRSFDQTFKNIIYHVNLSSFLQLQINEINIENTRLGEEEITGVAKQLNCIERLKVDNCEFEGSSFHRLCQEIENRNGEVGQVTHFLIFQQVT